MNRKMFHRTLLCLGMTLILPDYTQAAEINISGYASFMVGKALEQETLANGEKTQFITDPINSNFAGIPNDDARYVDDINFRPDTNIGIQLYADLAQSLSITTLLGATGANNFDAEIDRAYLTYQINNSFTLQVGRQRTPLYFYSDFIDVGYAYHWIRPPLDVYNNPVSNYEGASLKYSGAIGGWENMLRVYGGAAKSENSLFGDFNTKKMLGIEWNLSNDWLQLRASGVSGEFFTRGTTTGEDNPVDATFGSFSVHTNFERFFFIAEYDVSTVKDDYLDLFGSLIQTDFSDSYLFSAGLELGDLTPHITYSSSTIDLTGDVIPEFAGLQNAKDTITVGLRWDFHPSAAFKVEYSSVTDQSDDDFITLVGGKSNEVDAVTFGFDVVF